MEKVYKIVRRRRDDLYSLYYSFYDLINSDLTICYSYDGKYKWVEPRVGAVFAFKKIEDAEKYLYKLKLYDAHIFECSAEIYDRVPKEVPVLINSKQLPKIEKFWDKFELNNLHSWTMPKGTVLCKRILLEKQV